MPVPAESPSVGIVEMVAEGYTAPRASMARILAMRLDVGTLLMMVAVGAVAGAMARVVFAGDDPDMGIGGIVAGYVLLAITALVQFAFVGWLIGTLARAFGGQAEPSTGFVVAAWHTFVSTPLMIVFAWTLYGGGGSPMLALLFILAAILMFVLLAAYIAEAYGFTSTTRVAGTMLGMLVVTSFVLSLFVQMPPPA